MKAKDDPHHMHNYRKLFASVKVIYGVSHVDIALCMCVCARACVYVCACECLASAGNEHGWLLIRQVA